VLTKAGRKKVFREVASGAKTDPLASPVDCRAARCRDARAG
jgi:hypothetical protein